MDLSVIVVSYNTKKLLRECLESVERELKSSSFSGEVVVVDNNSTDGSIAALRRRKFQIPNSKFQIVENEENLGFAGANNLGAKQANGRYLLFLNSDTVVRPGALAEMVEFMDDNPSVGISSCKLTNPDGSIQPQGGFLPRLSTVLIWAWFWDDLPLLSQILPSYQLRRKLFFSGKPKELGWVAGTAMWVRREVWDELDGFDESLFMYGEDVELCYRARQGGWGVKINPRAALTHVGRASGAGGAGWAVGEVRGLIYLFCKHKPKWELPILRLILLIGMGFRWFIFGILGRNTSLREAYAQAVEVAGR